MQHECFDEAQAEVPQELMCIQANDQSGRVITRLHTLTFRALSRRKVMLDGY